MAGQIIEAARSVDVVHETDVLVVGSGPGGLSAALAAARAGARTTLLDRYGCFGGNMTQVGVESIGWYRHEQTVEADGIGRELEERAAAMGAANPESQSLSMGIDGERFKYVADVVVAEAGVTPMLHRLAVQPIVEDGAHPRRHHREQVGPRGHPRETRRRRDGRRRHRGPSRGTGAQDPARGDARRVGDVLDDRRQQAASSSRRSRPTRRRTGTGPATPNGTSRRPARRTSCSRRSSASRSSRRSRRA